ncbi:hypothetical protein S7335_1756 [Synechococcus sp. PCC 7335]|uniref:hypothetical protein n=1 Tax=Synechococcus sp. (strain ATCC 29403 / PCC 7335) TaxID=91464 RepID=UPI00017EE713|nr:hypothetical protein [Synechococcus sp. PCC 7335]EDX84059.1 hypothetical protein S7335_1756 [Synechococcus sp. PCC 7335]
MAANENENIKTSAEPGKGAAGDQWAVQVSQPVGDAVQPEGTKSMPGGDVEGNKQDIANAEASEADSDLKTTDGYVVDDSGRLNNFAIEPEMYVEK